jgi:prevent-host-death family protein
VVKITILEGGMKSIPSTKFRVIYSEILNRVAFNHETVRIERHGKPLAVVVPADVYNDLKKGRKKVRSARKPESSPHFSLEARTDDPVYVKAGGK